MPVLVVGSIALESHQDSNGGASRVAWARLVCRRGSLDVIERDGTDNE